METLLRKYLAAVDLVVIAVCAIFAARATATAIEAGMAGNVPSLRPGAHVAGPAPQGPIYSKQVEEILKRNIFCSTCPPILGQATTAGPPPVPELQKTSLPLKLLAIMYAPPPADPRWSMAIIRDNDSKTAGPYSVGSKIREAEIDDIDDTRVYLNFGGGRREFLELLDAAPPQPGAPAQPAPAAPRDPLAAELDKGIKKTGENRFEVQRSTLDSLLGNMGVLARAARIVPETRDGKSIGFRLFSIKPDGPFGKIGLQNGDIISAINGLEMTSPDKALEVYTKLRTANHLTVGLERNGQKVTMDYTIR